MKKVFLLETDPLMLKAWEVQLTGTSWELYALDNPEDFGFRVADFAPDLVVISDKIENFDAQIPIYLLTSDEVTEGEGIRGIIKKPLNISELESILDELLTQKS